MPASTLSQGIGAIRVDTPRDFGYTIGDKFSHEMHMVLNEPVRLDTSTLPEPGRLNRWLEISGVELDVQQGEKSATYRIVVEYQVFNAPQALTSVTVPQLEFMTMGGPNRIPVFMQEWTFGIGPITHSSSRENLRLQPDREPGEIPLVERRTRLAIWSLLLVSLLLYLAYQRLVLPRLRRNRYPFYSALREIRALQRSRTDPESYRRSLKAFHTAMNTTAGQVVFAANLDDFLKLNPNFMELGPDIASIYARSQDLFFEEGDPAEADSAWQELLDICRRCRGLERSVT
jgi:hypothetical protein